MTSYGDMVRASGRSMAVLALAIGLAAPASAAVVAEGASAALGVGASVTFPHTVASTPDQFLVVAVGVRSSSAMVNAVSYGGSPLSLIVSESAGGYCRSELWGLAGPSPGTRDVAVTLSAGNSASIAAAVSYAGVDGRSPIVNTASSHGTRGAVSLSVTSTPGEVVIDSVCGGANSAPSGTPGSGQTQRWNRTSGTLLLAGSDRPGAAAVTMQWTLSVPAALGWSIGAAALRPATGAGGPPGDAALPPDSAVADATSSSPDIGSLPDGAAADQPAAGDDGALAPADLGAARLAPDSSSTANGANAASPDSGPPAPSVTHLTVGCACRTSPHGSPAAPGAPWLALVAFHRLVRRLRHRPGA
jgi:hypothetical protein